MATDTIQNPQNSSDNTPPETEAAPTEVRTDEDNTLVKQLQEQLARAQADYANLVRRNREEGAQMTQWIEDKLILKFLPILDNLERSQEHIPPELRDNAWVEGNTSIVRAMQKVITDLNITPIISLGQEVDPDLHDVISQIPHQDTVIQAEIEKGYIRGGRTLRHAKVIVGDGQATS